MIRWCAYCQRFLGEVAPLDRYEITHGMCDACDRSGAFDEPDICDRTEPVRGLFRQIARLEPGPSESADGLVQRGLSLGLDPVDLLMGLVQPALYRIGRCWETGSASTREESLVTATCTNMLQSLLNRRPEFARCRQSPNPSVLLVNAQDNFHTLGLQLVEFVLVSNGVPTLTITPGLGAREVLALVGATRPRVVGIGVSIPTHFRGAREVAAGVRALPEADRPRVVVGGFAVKQGMEFDPALGFTACRDPRELVALVR